jgi:hypothetical protein
MKSKAMTATLRCEIGDAMVDPPDPDPRCGSRILGSMACEKLVFVLKVEKAEKWKSGYKIIRVLFLVNGNCKVEEAMF